MREIEFLPAWYPLARRRARRVVVQAWALGLLTVGVIAWVLLSQRSIHAAEVELDSLKSQLAQSQTEQRILDEQLGLRKELQLREQVLASLGYPVEMTRLIHTLDNVMPKEMSITDLICSTEEFEKQQSEMASVRATKKKEKEMDRRLKVKLVGVAPSDVDLANFLAGLTQVPFFEQVSISYARDKTEAGHILREFEVSWTMGLNVPVGS